MFFWDLVFLTFFVHFWIFYNFFGWWCGKECHLENHHFLGFFLLLVPSLLLQVGEIRVLVPEDTVLSHGTPLAVATPRRRLDTLGRDTPVLMAMCSRLMWTLNSPPLLKMLLPSGHLLPLAGGRLASRPALLPLGGLAVEEIAPTLSVVVCLSLLP